MTSHDLPYQVTALLELRWDHIMYTGNGSVGRIVMSAAAKHLTPVTLELGGKSPVIVDKTANVPLAAKRIAQGKWFANAGQVCISPDYVLVDRAVEAPLLDALAKEAREMLGTSREAHGVGLTAQDPDERAYGKIINERHVHRLASLLEDSGGTIVYGSADDIEPSNLYVPPIIVSRPKPDAELMRQEIFGPILPVCPVASIEESIDLVRHVCETPLALYVFSEDRAAVERVLKATQSGGAGVNTTMEHQMTCQMPFGGVGESGIGGYHGKFGFEEVYACAASPTLDSILASCRSSSSSWVCSRPSRGTVLAQAGNHVPHDSPPTHNDPPRDQRGQGARVALPTRAAHAGHRVHPAGTQGHPRRRRRARHPCCPRGAGHI